MKDFLLAALPWVAMGICLAVFFARSANEKKGEKAENYGSEGMSIGMCFGVAIGSSIEGGVGVGITVGMLIGLLVGSNIQKNTDGGGENQ